MRNFRRGSRLTRMRLKENFFLLNPKKHVGSIVLLLMISSRTVKSSEEQIRLPSIKRKVPLMFLKSLIRIQCSW